MEEALDSEEEDNDEEEEGAADPTSPLVFDGQQLCTLRDVAELYHAQW